MSFLHLLRQQHHFSKSARENFCSYPKDNLEKEDEIHQEEMYEVPQDRVICLCYYSPVLPHFLGLPTRIIWQATFCTQKQWYELKDSLGTEIELLYVIYHQNYNKYYFFTDSSELKAAPFPLFLLAQNL